MCLVPNVLTRLIEHTPLVVLFPPQLLCQPGGQVVRCPDL